MSDKIIIRNMAFFGYHGALTEETRLGQKFFVDLDLYVDLGAAGRSDDLADTLDYGAVYAAVGEIMEKSRFKLIEALAQRIVDELFARFEKVAAVRIVLRKPEAPVNGIFDHLGVEFERQRPG